MSFSRSDTLNVVASDHRPFTIKQKAMGKDDFTKIPHGLPGIQDRMSVIWEKGVVCVAPLFPAGRQTIFFKVQFRKKADLRNVCSRLWRLT